MIAAREQRGGEHMTPTERREAEIEIIRQKKQVTYSYFMREFGVSRETVRNDVLKLMCSYPIETVRGRYGGGVRICTGHTSSVQLEFLEELRPMMCGEKLDILNSIIYDFAP